MTTRANQHGGVVRRHKVLFAMLALTGLLLAAVGGWAVYLNQQISAIPRIDIDLGSDTGLDTLPDSGPGAAEGNGSAPARPPRATGEAAESLNILVAGLDAGESSRIVEELERDSWVPGSHRSDVIMVVHLSADRKQAYVVSIPRDTWVEIDGWGPAKINAAFSYGGPPLFVRTLEQFTGVRMDHLAVVDWTGFAEITKALGGVEVQQYGGTGTTVLDGETALEYVRERETLPRGDLDRIQRQQTVLRAISEQMAEAGTLTNPVRVTDVVNAVSDSIAVDKNLTNERMRELAMSLRNLRGDDVVQLTVPVERFDWIDRQSVVIVDRAKARALFAALAADELDEYLATHDADVLPEPGAVP